MPEAAAVRYAWARNPLGNLVNSQHHERILPVPSFRTDDWDWRDAPFPDRGTPEANEHRGWLNNLRKQADEWVRRRPTEEAEAILKQAKEYEGEHDVASKRSPLDHSDRAGAADMGG